MTVTANTIIAKSTDYKVCKHCSSINWYEKTYCHTCGHTQFTTDKRAVVEEADSYIDLEYDYRQELYEEHPEIDVGDRTFIEV